MKNAWPVASALLIFALAGCTLSINSEDPALTSSSPAPQASPDTLNSTPPVTLSFTLSGATSVKRHACSSALILRALDTQGIERAVQADTTLHLQAQNPSDLAHLPQIFSSGDCLGPALTTLTWPAGTSRSSIFLKHDREGSATVQAIALGAPLGAAVSPTISFYVSPGTWTDQAGAPYGTRPRLSHSAVWTGSEMIAWGGADTYLISSGARYDPVSDSWTGTTSKANAPSARYQHTAVWTGTEMIVWGGIDSSNPLATGGRYNPATDTWTPTATLGAPAARDLHSAVWTGSEMLIWGGYDSSTALGTGGRYNPGSDSWGPAINTTGAPASRYSHGAVWTGSEMIITMGRNVGYANDGKRYNPVTDTWGSALSTTGAPFQLYAVSAIWTGSKMILWGGHDFTSPVQSGMIYDGASDSWVGTTSLSGAPTARINHSAVWSGSEMLVYGGDTGNGAALGDGGRYDPTADHWRGLANPSGPPYAAYSSAAVWTGSEFLIWGGSADGVYAGSGGKRYDPLTNAWTATSSAGAPGVRSDHSAVWTGDKMLIWGGYASAGSADVNDGAAYAPATDTWDSPISTAGAPTVRSDHSAIWTGGKMIVWGGINDLTQTRYADGAAYDLATNTWGAPLSITGAPSARSGHSAVWTGSSMLVWGGGEVGSTVAASGKIYDPVADAWTGTISTLGAPAARVYHAAVWSGEDMIVWGGFDDNGIALADGGRYDPATELWSSTGVAVPATFKPRGLAGVAWTGSRMIVFGGATSGYTESIGGAYYDP